MIKIYWLAIIIGMLLIPSIAYTYGQVNQTKTEPRTFMDCYISWAFWGKLANTFSPVTIDVTDPDIKAFFSNMCNFAHEKTGKWISTMDSNLTKITSTFNKTEFENKYYPNGIPDSVQRLVQGVYQISPENANQTK